MASHFNNDSRGIITQDEPMNQLIRPHQILDISIQLTAKLTAKPVENSEQWETSVDKAANSEKTQSRPRSRSTKV